MQMLYKSKRVPKLGDSLKLNLSNRHFWKGIEASQVAVIYKDLGKDIPQLVGSQMVSWKDKVIKIKATSAVQRQEIILRQTQVLDALKKKGVEAKEIKVIT